MRFKDCSIHCEYCQSYPTNHICHHPNMIVIKDNGKYLFRECVHSYSIFDPDWQLFPCPFMDGEIRFHKSGNEYDVLEVKEGAFMES